MTFKDRKARTASKKDLAKILKTTVKRVNRLKICNKPLESVLKRDKKAQKAAEHREKCLNHAKMVTNKQISIKKAARECDISERQMSRYILKVLQQPNVPDEV